MESVVVYRSFVECTKNMTPKDFKEFWMAIFEYSLNGKEPEEFKNEMVGAIFKMAKPQIDANTRRRNNGNKGGRPKAENESVPEKKKPGFRDHEQRVYNFGELEKEVRAN